MSALDDTFAVLERAAIAGERCPHSCALRFKRAARTARSQGKAMSDWTNDRIERLKGLWAEGYSGSDIARYLGGLTRNAVIGKVNRLGLPGRAKPRARKSGPTFRAAPKKAEPTPPVELPPVTLPDGKPVTTMTVNDRMCRFPKGDPVQQDFRFCGHQCAPGKSWCEFHTRIVFVRSPERSCA